MNYFTYCDSPFSVRDDLKMAHQNYWKALSEPGSWWTGRQRIAIAKEVRNATTCQFCKDRKHALSPNAVQGSHDHNAEFLSEEAIDAIHRIVTDQTRITQAYVDSNIERGLTQEAYVELTGIVVTVFSIDEFHRGLGLDPELLPEAISGQCDHYRPAQAKVGTGFVAMIPADEATGAEADLWPPGISANVLRALSLVPNALRQWYNVSKAQYLSLEGMGNFVKQDDRSLNRMQMELIAGRVSAINECFY
ncbi:MAG: hypothetical protein ACI92E_001477 [Oceanicoccus sp.]|jgi:hypothetical protein